MAAPPRLTLLLFALLLVGADARGAGALQADVLPLAMQPRSGAPALFDLRLTHRGAGLLEGRVEIALSQNTQPVLRWTTPEVFLTGGPQTLRLLTPPLPPRYPGLGLEATLTFLTANGRIALGTAPFAPEARREERRSVIAICAGPGGQTHAPDGTPTWHRLRPLGSRDLAKRSDAESTATAPIFFEPEDFPVDPLVCCAFDLVILRESALERLRPRSAEALVRWLEAGGGLALLGVSENADELRAALDRVIAAGRGGVPIEASGGRAPGMLRGYVGLGRCVILASTVSDESWTKAADFLWARDANAPTQLSTPVNAGNRWRKNEDVASFFQVLMPRNVQLLPAWQVFGILAVLVAVVGPLDWLLLGRLRARRWTWVLFPVAVLAATAATIFLANRSLGQTAHRGAVTIKDIGPDGRVLRTNRFELTLVPRARAVSETLVATLAVPLPPMRADYRGLAWSGEDRTPRYLGQFPARYELQRSLQQWSPSIVRTLAFGGKDDSGLPWDLFEPSESNWKKPTDGAKLREEAHGWQVSTVHQFSIVDHGSLFYHQGSREFPAPFVKRTIGMDAEDAPIEAIAPNGNALCEDLGMSDRHDPRQWLLVAVRRVGTDIQIYRRLFFQ